MDFSVILQAPDVRAIVQDGVLERAFHDALFPNMQFRGEVVVNPWPLNSGDSQIFTAPGLMAPKQRPLVPGQDPAPSTYGAEQWEATIGLFADSIDTHMPTSITAAVDLFLRNAHQLGMSGAQALNRIVRNRMYNAAMSGWTVADGLVNNAATMRVKRLNGFTRARRPTLAGASPVRYNPVSSSNPLPITVAGVTAVNVIGFTPDNPGDEIGPGVLTLDANITCANRDAVQAFDCSNIVRIGGGLSIDALSPTDVFNLAGARAMIASFWQQNVPPHEDGRFHAHIDPTNISQGFDDQEFQRLNTSLPDYVLYREFALGEVLNTVFFRNNEDPIQQTVQPFDGLTFTLDDDFGGELFTGGATTGVAVHRVLFTGKGGIHEYRQDMSALITEAGVTGKVAEPSIVNNGIDVMSDGIELIIRGPLNRLQDMISVSWKFMGTWAVRTDGASGSAARYKRFGVVETGS